MDNMGEWYTQIQDVSQKHSEIKILFSVSGWDFTLRNFEGFRKKNFKEYIDTTSEGEYFKYFHSYVVIP